MNLFTKWLLNEGRAKTTAEADIAEKAWNAALVTREEAPAKVGEPAETGNGPLYDLVAFLRPEFREETKLHLARRTSDLLRAQPQAREDAQPFGYWVEHRSGENPVLIRYGSFVPASDHYKITTLYTRPAPDALRVARQDLAALKADQKGGA